MTMTEKILCVDDDVKILSGIRRQLGEEFDPLVDAWHAIAKKEYEEADGILMRLDEESESEHVKFARAVLSSLRRRPGLETVGHLGAALRLCPRMPAALWARGVGRASLGDLEGGIEDLTRAILLKPDYVAAHTSRGIVRQKKGDYEGLRSKTGSMDRISHLSMCAGDGRVFFVDRDRIVGSGIKGGSGRSGGRRGIG